MPEKCGQVFGYVFADAGGGGNALGPVAGVEVGGDDLANVNLP